MSFPADLRASAESLLATARSQGRTIVTAESCTGGLVAALLTEIPGSSDVFERGYVTYSNAAKIADLGVSPALLDAHGAVSAEVAIAMAEGARARASADFALAVTGVAGPGGGTAKKPVGLVYLAIAQGSGTAARECRFGPLARSAIREETLRVALALLLGVVATRPEPPAR
jgi:nicotinamide-nucleotide amidase